MSDSPGFTRALAGYDDAFRERMLTAVSRTIATESLIIEGDTRVMALRTAETCDALVVALISTLALSPGFDNARTLRETADDIARRIRRGVASARASGTFDRFGAAGGGQA